MNKYNNDNSKKRITHSINKFRMKRNSNMKIFYPKLKKEDFHNSYLARTFKKHFIFSPCENL